MSFFNIKINTLFPEMLTKPSKELWMSFFNWVCYSLQSSLVNVWSLVLIGWWLFAKELTCSNVTSYCSAWFRSLCSMRPCFCPQLTIKCYVLENNSSLHYITLHCITFSWHFYPKHLTISAFNHEGTNPEQQESRRYNFFKKAELQSAMSKSHLSATKLSV